MKPFIFIFFLLLLITSCDPCSDCGEPFISEPTVKMIFINQDSIRSLDLAINSFESLDAKFTLVKANLAELRNSLRQIQESLDIGSDEYQDEKESLLKRIKQKQQDSLFYETQEIASKTSVLNTTKSIINSGLILVNQISIPEIDSIITYSDSAASWNFPLSFENKFSIYEVLIHDERFTIELDYETFAGADEDRNIRIRARNIQVIDASFDSLNICEQNCIDGEASFTFYF
ncbi:MAG: hypothetical protein GDA42_04590 [Ekhidna sp.]|nr:hypothetical protein [Ekhidna sp.]MBC6409724.1 hypothetical protein [Ekhidna sp.]